MGSHHGKKQTQTKINTTCHVHNKQENQKEIEDVKLFKLLISLLDAENNLIPDGPSSVIRINDCIMIDVSTALTRMRIINLELRLTNSLSLEAASF